MSKLLHDFEEFLKNDTFGIFDDFFHHIDGDDFTLIADGTASAADGDAVGGVLTLTANTTDENEAYVKGTHEVFKFATDKPLLFAARVRPIVNTILKSKYLIGLKNALAADQLPDASVVPVITGSGAFFYKLDQGVYWVCTATANGSESVLNGVTTEHTVGNNAWDILVIKTIPISSTQTEVHFFSADEQSDGSYSLNEVGLQTSGKQFVAQVITHTSATEMQIALCSKAGGSSDSNVLEVDWVYCAQKR